MWDQERETPALVLRATSGWAEWASNLTVGVYQHPVLGPVHAGYAMAATQIFNAMPGKLRQGGQVVVAGHSRGGALAQLLAAFLVAEGSPPTKVVTFGSPRVGQEKLKEILAGVDVRLYRCGDDAVPYWPDPPFVDVRPLLQVGRRVNPFDDHSIQSYFGALKDAKRTPAIAA